MTYTAWSADGRVVPINDRFASGLFIETWTPINKQQTARSTRAGGGAASPISPDDAPAPTTLRVCKRCGAKKPISDYPMRKNNHIKTCKACMPQYQEGGKPERAAKRAWTRRNKEKRSAHKAVEVALSRGELKKEPCVYCGTKTHVQAHHDDYSAPLSVMWLCPKHHSQRHIEIGRPLGPPRKELSLETRESSKAAAPIFSVKDRLQLIADDE